MSTDKLQATIAQILGEPPLISTNTVPSPPTFFDEEPYDAAQASEKVAKASDKLRLGPEIPKEGFGQLTSRELGTSPREIHEAHSVRDEDDVRVIAEVADVLPSGDG